MTKKEVCKRCFIFTLGVYIMTFAIRMTISANLGTTPLSTLPNILSIRFENISFGTMSCLWNLLLVVMQIVILRKKFKAIQFIQVPLSLLFGIMLNLSEWLLMRLNPQTYLSKYTVLIIGCILLALSISLTIQADLVMNSGEAIVMAIVLETGWNFGYVKVALDVIYVLCGLILSIVFWGALNGIGIGTLICAVITGFIVNFFNKILYPFINKFFGAKCGR
ncbi:MAG: DUF6198 family protein [Bacillota bacterium]|nr:DUF6198 family protein [Bacillota bacterium]